MKLIYKYDPMTFKFAGTDEIIEDAAVPSNTTLIPVPNQCYEPTFDIQTQTWNGITEAEYLQKLKQNAETKSDAQPTQNQKLLMDQQATITNLQKELDKQKDTTSQLKQLAMNQQATISQLKKGSN